MLGDAERHGAMLALCSPVLGGRVTPHGIELDVGGETPDQPTTTLCARSVVNSAGLHAPALARTLAGLDARHVPQDHLAKGCYFTLPGRAPFSRLVWTNEEAGEAGAVTTVTFTEKTGKTLVVVSELYPSKAALDEAITSGSTSGDMNEQFDQLEELLAASRR